MVLLKSRQFWVLVVGVLLFVIQSYVPSFPFDAETILKLLFFVLALFGIEPELRARGLK